MVRQAGSCPTCTTMTSHNPSGLGSLASTGSKYLSGPGGLVGSRVEGPAIVVEGLPVAWRDLWWRLLLELLLLLQGLEVGMLLLQLPLQALRLPLLLQLLPLVLLGPRVGRRASAGRGPGNDSREPFPFSSLPGAQGLPPSLGRPLSFPGGLPFPALLGTEGLWGSEGPVTRRRACSWSSCCWRTSSWRCSSSSLCRIYSWGEGRRGRGRRQQRRWVRMRGRKMSPKVGDAAQVGIGGAQDMMGKQDRAGVGRQDREG